MPIRETKKQRTRARLLASARALFARDGYAATRMEAIAEDAEVGTGTVYNYFPSKTVLVVAMCDELVEAALADGAQKVRRPSRDPARALTALLCTHLSIARRLDRALLREVLGAAFTVPPETLRSFVSMDLRMMSQIAELLGKLDEKGRLRPGVDVQSASALLYAIVGGAFMMYAGIPEVGLEDLETFVRTQVGLVVDGIAVPR